MRAARGICGGLAACALALAGATLIPGLAAAQDLPATLAPAGSAVGGLGGLEGAVSGVGRNAGLLVVVMTALSLAPGLAVAVTCFPFIVTVMSILRQSIGLPQSPPNMLIIVLSMFLSWYVMDPVLREAWQTAGKPLQAGSITLTEAFQRGIEPFRTFMEARTDPDTLAALRDVAPGGAQAAPAAVPPAGASAPAGPADGAGPAAGASLSVLVPSFMLSEIQRAFEVGFLITLPFLIIDMVVSAVLMSMGMMMVPPAVVSLPFKLAFFVVVDGWGMLATALVRSYQGGG